MQASIHKIQQIKNQQSAEDILADFLDTRKLSLSIAEPLSEADCQLQSMPDASPIKWHLAHTSWFFETFILKKFVHGYTDFSPHFDTLFNSYYNAIGAQYSRPQRGLLSRPSLSEIVSYRKHVEANIEVFLQSETCPVAVLNLMEIGIQHEKQHQELMLTDIQHALFQNPMMPAYSEKLASEQADQTDCGPINWIDFEGGLVNIGADEDSYAFDNERPRHQYFLKPYRLASRTVINAEYLEFLESGAYQQPEHWLADGWAWLQENKIQAPLYWLKREEGWSSFGLAGLKPLNPNQSVCHLNYYEANAYANWAGKRLPTEFEWENAVQKSSDAPNYLNLSILQPQAVNGSGLSQMFGNIWEWTSSGYQAYPGFKPFAGDAGEYNGKFMSGQFVLKGGSCVSPENHIRASYRNFFYPHQSWQYSGIRLAEDLS